MRSALLFFIPAFLWAAAPENIVKPEPNARLRELVAHADRVIVTSAGLHPADLKNQKVLLDIHGAPAVARFTALFQFTGEYSNVSRFIWNGEEVMAISNCLCTGSHMLSFIQDGQEILAMSLHHWTHVRPSRGWKSHDIDLTRDSSDRVRAFLTESIPMENWANKPLQPTPGSVTPRASESTSK